MLSKRLSLDQEERLSEICDDVIEETGDNQSTDSKAICHLSMDVEECPQQLVLLDIDNDQSINLLTTKDSIVTLKDCNSTKRLEQYNNEEKPNSVSHRKKVNKYFPQFKTKVISYALNHSIKEAAIRFRVNRSTVSTWIRQWAPVHWQAKAGRQDSLLKPSWEGEDVFLGWLGQLCQERQLITRELLQTKIRHLLEASQTERATSKKYLWFFLYSKRLEEGLSLDKNKIQYPFEFKQLVALHATYSSKKHTSRVFFIDRKRVSEWVSHFKNVDEKFKKRDVSKYVTDANIDREIWDWYVDQETPPTSRQVREKGVCLYQRGGYPGMRCSAGWYYRWRARYKSPPPEPHLFYRSRLLSWALSKLELNQSITYDQLLQQAVIFKEYNFQVCTKWVFQVCKNYLRSGHLPNLFNQFAYNLMCEVNNFRQIVRSSINDNNIPLSNVVAFDEIPLSFATCSDPAEDPLLLETGWDHPHASLIVSCAADGTLLPTALILKSGLGEMWSGDGSSDDVLVLTQKEGKNDKETTSQWLQGFRWMRERGGLLVCDRYAPHLDIVSAHPELFVHGRVQLHLVPGGCTSQLHPPLLSISSPFKRMVAGEWHKWRHELSWLTSTGRVELPTSSDIVRWVHHAHTLLQQDYEEIIKAGFVYAGLVGSSQTQ